MLFWYVTRAAFVAIAGKAVSAYADPKQKVFPPTVAAFLTAANGTLFGQFARELFLHTGLVELFDESLLLHFRDTMIACFLMHLKDFSDDATKNDVVMAKMRESARAVGISYEQLLEWGKLVHERFHTENSAQAVNSARNPDIVRAMQKQSQEICETRKEIQELKAQYTADEAVRKEDEAVRKEHDISNKRKIDRYVLQ